jgi:tRNA modification GTPase
MLPRHDQPIVAIATAPGRGAVGIVRVSAKADLGPLIEALCNLRLSQSHGSMAGRCLTPRHALLTPFLDASGQALDRGLALYFAAPHSYTGESVLELQAHGGPVVLQLLMARCLEAAQEPCPSTGQARLAGLRLANPGEFTQRAFLNRKLDLAQAEAVSDLIDASTEAAARSAGRSLSGVFSAEIHALCGQLIELRVLVEATLDFPEEDLEILEKARVPQRLQAALDRLDRILSRTRQGVLLREGLHVVLAGQPNVGKSALLNALAGVERSIVTPIAGTTRDHIRETIQIEGIPVHVTDTAGLRDVPDAADALSADVVERIGVERSWKEIQGADAVLFVHDLTRLGQTDYDTADALITERLALVKTVGHGVVLAQNDKNGTSSSRILHIYNKSDQVPENLWPAQGCVLSALTGSGLSHLRQTLLDWAGWQQTPADGLFTARSRHVQALQAARAHLTRALSTLSETALDLLAEELRLAYSALGDITGEMTSDELLGEIFGRFCIGK